MKRALCLLAAPARADAPVPTLLQPFAVGFLSLQGVRIEAAAP